MPHEFIIVERDLACGRLVGSVAESSGRYTHVSTEPVCYLVIIWQATVRSEYVIPRLHVSQSTAPAKRLCQENSLRMDFLNPSSAPLAASESYQQSCAR